MEKNNDKFLMASIALLKPSETNPRKIFNELELQELAESIKQVGIINPITVRRSFDDSRGMYYEIVSGERRYRAAKLAGLTMVPVIIRDLSDEEVLEVQIIENLQRNDVHPMDEAYGFKNLLAAGKYNISALAEKVGKSETYVYQRLKLLDLIPEVQEAYMQGCLNLPHVTLLSRLQTVDQKRAFSEIALNGEGKLEHPDNIRSSKWLKQWIDTNILLDLHKVGFKKDDPHLYPAAGACTKCPNRTGFNKNLFPELDKRDSCTYPICFNMKLKAFIEAKKAKLTNDNKRFITISTDWSEYNRNEKQNVVYRSNYTELKSGDSCESEVLGLISHGEIDKIGKSIRICADKSCKIHHPYSTVKSPEEKKEAREKKVQVRLKEKLLNEVLTSLSDIVPAPYNRKELEHLLMWMFNNMGHDCRITLFKRHEWEATQDASGYRNYHSTFPDIMKSLPDVDIYRLMYEITFIRDVKFAEYQSNPGQELLAMARTYDVNIDSIQKSLEKELNTKGSKKQNSSSEEIQDSAA